jgi:hypothetical protein
LLELLERDAHARHCANDCVVAKAENREGLTARSGRDRSDVKTAPPSCPRDQSSRW